MKEYEISVKPRVGERLSKIAPQLAELGIKVEVRQEPSRFVHVHKRPNHLRHGWDSRRGPRFKLGDTSLGWTIAAHAWLVFQILRTTIGSWPKIIKLLQKAGLKRDEIITLGLQEAIIKTKKRRASRKKSKKSTAMSKKVKAKV